MGKKIPRIALIYDFDGTLAPGNMQEHSFIPDLGISINDFWNEVRANAKKHDMSEILSYMYLMIEKSRISKKQFNKTSLKELGRDLKLFPGVDTFFDNINTYVTGKGLKAEHYIISSGLYDILVGSPIHKHFEKIYASKFMYDANDTAVWPAVALDYTAKTQFLFRINKGINNNWDNSEINKYVDQAERPMPFSRMIYLGDGETDVPAMKMINFQGGTSIAVYDKGKRAKGGRPSGKNICKELINQKRANFMAEANYSEGSDLYKIITHTIDKIAAESELSNFRK
jgi:2-hydroxy-3-keto-5-methylthiopentenyl-1-phosphate phosphatase